MSKKIRVAIIGVGNCASALVQGVQYYKDVNIHDQIPGLMHPMLGNYAIKDIEFVAAFDVNANKVDKPLEEAIFETPNNTAIVVDSISISQVSVMRGPTLDGLNHYLREVVEESSSKVVDVASVLKETDVDVVVNFLPVGSEQATRWYVQQVLEAKCALVNCIPVFIASNRDWRITFKRQGLPVIGDDIKSQVGATIVHRALAQLFKDRGATIGGTYQLNFGGNSDFLNMLDRDRLTSKKISKTKAVTSIIPLDNYNIHVGPSDHVPWLNDKKICYIVIKGTGFGDLPISLDVKLEVWDSYNSAGVVVDAIRCAKIGLDNGLTGALVEPSAYFMKSPPAQFSDSMARDMLEEWINTFSNDC